MPSAIHALGPADQILGSVLLMAGLPSMCMRSGADRPPQRARVAARGVDPACEGSSAGGAAALAVGLLVGGAAVHNVRVPFPLSVALRSLKFIPRNGRTIERPFSGLVQVTGSVARMPVGPHGAATNGMRSAERVQLQSGALSQRVCGQREALRRAGHRLQYLPPVTSDGGPRLRDRAVPSALDENGDAVH